MDTLQRAAMRFLMAGSVDDGKSTLTGRLLYECNAIPADQLSALERKSGNGDLDFSLLADGLEAEREQGITIDVAHRYFATTRRKFIIGDAPGHEQYTRNMVTAASDSDAAVILVDITKIDLTKNPVQLLQQTHRHALIIKLLDVKSVIFAVNKMDATGDPPSAFAKVRDAIYSFARAAHIPVAGILPLSARLGENVAKRSYGWYNGPSLLELLESLPAGDHDIAGDAFLMPVQYVSRNPITGAAGASHANSERTFWGRVARGHVRAGDPVEVLPSRQRANVASVHHAAEEVSKVPAGESAGVVLDRHVDVARGSWLATPNSIESSDRFMATLTWMDNEPAQVGRKYLIRHGTQWLQGRIAAVESCLDVHTLAPKETHDVCLNDIAEVIFETAEPVPLAPYRVNHIAGAMLLVDNASHRTSGVLMVTKVRWDAEGDRRGDPRVAVDITARYDAGSASGIAAVENIGTGGLMMVVGDTDADLGPAINVSFDIPDVLNDGLKENMRVTGRVVAQSVAEDGQSLYHLAFEKLALPQYETLSRFVRR